MKDNILFCVSTETLALPKTIGLSDEILGLPKTCYATTAAQARRIASDMSGSSSAYIIGCDDMEPINLTAAIVSDNPNLRPTLVVDRLTGSLSTRCQAAGINSIMTLSQLSRKFDGSVPSPQLSKSGKHEKRVEENDDLALFENDIYCVDEAKESVTPSKPQNSNCWIMSVYSGSGGVGKSTIVAVVANLLSALGRRVLMIDCDLQFGDLSHIGDAITSVDFETVKDDASEVNRLFAQDSENRPFLIKAPSRIEDSEVISQIIRSTIARASENFEAIIVNTGTNWSEVNATLLEISNCNLFVVDQRISSVRSCKHALDLTGRMNIATHSFAFALNNCDKKAMLSGLDVMGAIDADVVHEIKNGGEKVEQYLSAGKIRDYLSEKSDMCLSVFSMLCELCPLCESTNKSAPKKKPWSFR